MDGPRILSLAVRESAAQNSEARALFGEGEDFAILTGSILCVPMCPSSGDGNSGYA
jgi:hypothetical protein